MSAKRIGLVIKNDDIIFFQIKFNKKADIMYVYYKKDNQEMLNFSLAQLKKCGNGICDEIENYSICKIDCPAGSRDGYCDRIRDRICDIDCLNKNPYDDLDCYEINKIKNKKEYDEFVKSQINYNLNNDKINNNKITNNKIKNKKEINKLKASVSLFILLAGILILVISIYYWHKFNKDQ